MKFKKESFSLKVGDYVQGTKGKHTVKGTVLESEQKKGKPAVFSRYGFVGVWVLTDGGNKTVINNVSLA